jgi:acetyl esterase/lipase
VSPADAQEQSQRPAVTPDGTVSASIAVPLSSFLSAEAKAAFLERLMAPSQISFMRDGIPAARAATDQAHQEILKKWLDVYPASIVSSHIDGVRVDTITPASGISRENAARVLINVHGGGFYIGGNYGGQIESVPVAGRGRIKVVAIDYRLAPEHTFPAASEDVATVYRHLLKTYKAENIGIFGCSAGGTLTGQSLTWFQAHNLPRPGAAGIFCSGLLPTFWYGGDAAELAGFLNGTPPQRPPPRPMPAGAPRSYFHDIDENDPRVTPGLFPEVLRGFPPTLLVTGTRDVAMSNAIETHMRLLQVNVDAHLIVQDGMGHGHFNSFAGTPEAKHAYDVIWRFFDRYLGR